MLWVKETGHSWDALAAQPNRLGKLEANERPCLKNKLWASEMSHQIETFSSKSEDMSSIPVIYTVGGENQLSQVTCDFYICILS